MKTFIDLYQFLQTGTEDNIITWLDKVSKENTQEAGYLQEALLRLFAGLSCISKLKSYEFCKGNFNKDSISKFTSNKEIFYDAGNNSINYRGNKGDSSDLTGISRENDKHFLVTTSKINSQVKNLEVDSIFTNFSQYEIIGYTMSLCICVKNNDEFQEKIKRTEASTHILKERLAREDTIIIDWDDLNQANHEFKRFYGGTPIDNIINSNKTTLCLKMHQRLGVMKTLELKKCENKEILWGHIPRSGKSYIIGGCIIADSENKDKCNYLIITTAPNETIEQQRKVFDCIQLTDFNIIVLNGKNKEPNLTEKNIILCSKQFLQIKIDKGHKECVESTKDIKWLKEISFDMRFIDESHNGGTTELAQKTLEVYGKQAFTVQITATYSKPINDYNIPMNCWILWDLEDIKLCKNIKDAYSKIRLVDKHGYCIKDIISKYSDDNVINEYSKVPEFMILTNEINPEVVTELKNDTQDNNYGWSIEGCFLLKQSLLVKKYKYTLKCKKIVKDEFQKEGENVKIWYRIFGKKDKFGISDNDYPDNIVFMKRIENICKNQTIDSRFIGEGDFHNEPMIIMAFLPQNNIDKISKATKKLLERYNVIPDYIIISINSKTTNNPKQSIEDARIKARNSGKKGVLVLSGKQCSLGVSIDNCDIVLLLNNNMGFDMIYQMMMRCMTEGKNKKCGFVVDLNIHRVIQKSLINYASLIKPDIHPREAIQFILQERLIILNGDHWMPSFGNNLSKITALCENVYDIYSSNTEIALKHFLNRLSFKVLMLTSEEQSLFNADFSNIRPTKIQKKLIYKLSDEDTEEIIKDGIEKIYVDTEDIDTEDIDTLSDIGDEDEKEEKQVNYMDILKHIIPLICLFTIHNKETSFINMFQLIEEDDNVYNILLDQIKSWWGKSIDSNILKRFINVYIKYMKDDKETNQIIRTVKELFMKNITNNIELSKLIDKYLIPQEYEKKSNAEVSTPYKLRQKMLDKIPNDFWTSIKKVFEPCAGKGGFIVDIIGRFMNGLEKTIPDKKVRYKTIVEGCLYFSDINPTNIFICKLLVDPYNEYELNVNEGNTLELDIKEKWDIDGFDAVIGNPPYNSSGDTGTGNTIWQDFTKISLNKLLKKNGYLLYVHPPGWRKPNTKRGKFYGLYKLMAQENQMIYLSIHGIKDGQKTFNCGTRYDWYIIQHKSKYTTTIVNDEINNNIIIDMNNFDWLPNYNIHTIQNILAKEHEQKCIIIYDRTSYGADKKNRVSKTKNDDFKYPCIHSTPKNGIRYMYSNVNDRGHFGLSKVIFGESGIYNPVIDMEGKYGMTHGAMAIQVDNLEEAKNISKVIQGDKFDKIIKSCLFSSFRIDWNIFKDFKKDFWKEFI